MADNNVILTTKTFAKLVLFDLGNRLNVAKNMSRALAPEFAKPGYKIGDTVQVRKPYRFIGGDGIGWDPEPLVDQVINCAVNSVPHVHFQWDSIGKTLNIREAMRLYTNPVSIAIASKVNAAAATFAANNALNSVGTPGTAPTAISTIWKKRSSWLPHPLAAGKNSSSCTLVAARRPSCPTSSLTAF